MHRIIKLSKVSINMKVCSEYYSAIFCCILRLQWYILIIQAHPHPGFPQRPLVILHMSCRRCATEVRDHMRCHSP